MTSTLMSDEALRDYITLRETTDPIEAFNLFIKRNCDPSLLAHFMDSDDNEAEFVRRTIKQQQQAAVGEVLGRLEDKAVKAGIPWSGYVSGTTLELAIPLTAIQAERTRNENGGKV